jgi:alpha-glucosidase
MAVTFFRTTLLLIATVAAAFCQAKPVSVDSPDGNLTISFQTVNKDLAPADAGQIVYSVTYHKKPLIDSSALRLELQGRSPLGNNVRIANAAYSKADQVYHLVTGKASTVRNHYNAATIDMVEPDRLGRKLTIEARAYDDAVAFRYVIPGQPMAQDFRLTNEDTEFRISKDATTYALELPNYRTMYESEFIKLPASAFANQGGVPGHVLIGLPLLMEVPGVAWMAITEADIEDNSSMYLVNPGPGWSAHWFQSRLAPDVNDPDIVETGTLPHNSAWRVLLVGDKPGRLIESNVITSLNPETTMKDTSWIHPGRASWDWWSGSIGPDGKPAFTTATMKYYVDFAAQSGFEYMLVDAGWSPMDDITRMNGRVDIPELVRYAATKNVKVWIWVHSTPLNRQLEEALPLYEKWGVAGIKTDFISRDDQSAMRFYYRVAEQAAAHHLMVDFHGATKPSGMERTWPNVMGYEAVAGMEQSKGGARANPDHDVTLPFTRMLAGRMDYTPGGFNNVTREEFEARSVKPMVMGTRAHQLAMYAIYESPFQMVSDYPGAYKDQPAFEFIQHVPASWDETHVLNGEPGQYITIARRAGDVWYLGSVAG